MFAIDKSIGFYFVFLDDSKQNDTIYLKYVVIIYRIVASIFLSNCPEK